VESIQFRQHFSLSILARLVFLGLSGALLLIWKLDVVNQVYFRDQLTATGIVINGAIIALFAIGMLKLIANFVHYAAEEKALLRFLGNIEQNNADPLAGVQSTSLIHRRYWTMELLHSSHTPIKQNALAAALVATESTRASLPRFINNVLILTGVFGTIVSLSMALIGASDMLESSIDISGMGMIVHGMSTALSTTITAILCFLFFGYFHIKLHDVQTNLISAIEQTTNHFLLPRFHVSNDSLMQEFSGLIRSVQQLVHRLDGTTATLQAIEQEVFAALDAYQHKVHSLSSELGDIRATLRQGFRLPEDTPK
jgi:hypothetical protein